mmetsp:Transcript_30321/g.77347  ORF Transcript_30321/g.77347 Transcript_30321/m.77347 type:complete len:213 (+) Transcript_30321:675-1313(+)
MRCGAGGPSLSESDSAPESEPPELESESLLLLEEEEESSLLLLSAPFLPFFLAAAFLSSFLPFALPSFLVLAAAVALLLPSLPLGPASCWEDLRALTAAASSSLLLLSSSELSAAFLSAAVTSFRLDSTLSNVHMPVVQSRRRLPCSAAPMPIVSNFFLTFRCSLMPCLVAPRPSPSFHPMEDRSLNAVDPLSIPLYKALPSRFSSRSAMFP